VPPLQWFMQVNDRSHECERINHITPSFLSFMSFSLFSLQKKESDFYGMSFIFGVA
jgi:hypothetical protein